MLQTNGFSARGLIERSNVAALCTTDDPADGLHYHQLLAEEGFPAEVLPAWRPDAALSIEKADFPQYIARLKAADGGAADTIGGLCGILKRRMDHFAANGCRLSDHGMADIPFRPVTEEEADAVYQKALRGGTALRYRNRGVQDLPARVPRAGVRQAGLGDAAAPRRHPQPQLPGI